MGRKFLEEEEEEGSGEGGGKADQFNGIRDGITSLANVILRELEGPDADIAVKLEALRILTNFYASVSKISPPKKKTDGFGAFQMRLKGVLPKEGPGEVEEDKESESGQ